MAFSIAVVYFFLHFFITSLSEKKTRAAIISLFSALIVGFLTVSVLLLLPPDSPFLIVVPVCICFITIVFFIPLGHSRDIPIEECNEQVDERDTMFAREDYEPGTKIYDDYYSRQPENKRIDDKIRKLPWLMAPGAKYYDPVRSHYIETIFESIHELTNSVDGDVNPSKIELDILNISREIKKITRHLGAVEVGFAPLNQSYVYSHVGRGPEPYGEKINLSHKSVIVFTIEMDYEKVEKAPQLPITEETALRYLDVTIISIVLARFIRDLGYPARAHISGSNYQIMLPAVAYDAGLGELGRHGYLISPRFGSRIRLGAVTTDLPLLHDKPINFGVQDFCDKCKRCATNCPSASIPLGNPQKVKGVTKWPLEVESCMTYWRNIGTDCGICMKVCPFSHPSSLVHNLVRMGIKNSSFVRTVSVLGEDLFYGKKAPY